MAGTAAVGVRDQRRDGFATGANVRVTGLCVQGTDQNRSIAIDRHPGD